MRDITWSGVEVKNKKMDHHVANAPRDDRVVANVPRDDRVVANVPRDDRVVANAPRDDRVVANVPRDNVSHCEPNAWQSMTLNTFFGLVAKAKKRTWIAAFAEVIRTWSAPFSLMVTIKSALCGFILMMLSACPSQVDYIAPDDFGFPKISVDPAGVNVVSNGTFEISGWKDSGLVSNGQPLFLITTANSSWADWFGEQSDVKQQIINDQTECKVGGTTTVTKADLTSTNTTSVAANSATTNSTGNPWCTKNTYLLVENRPCLFMKGKGIYGLLANPTVDPNQNSSYKVDPTSYKGYTYHLGESNPNLFDRGKNVGGTTQDPTQGGGAKAGWKAYFKVLSNYYQDNFGDIVIVVKRGLIEPTPGPIETIKNYMQDTLITASKHIFVNLISESKFILVIRICLTLYMASTMLFFILGILELNQKEFMVRLFKIAIVTQLITAQSSWSFFHDYFFLIFINGADDLMGAMLSSITGDVKGFAFFDNFFKFFFSYETTGKILSLLFSCGTGFIIIPLVYLGVGLMAIYMFSTVIIYILAMLTISLLLSLAPIFLSFMLFKITNGLYKNWLKGLIVYSIQQFVILACFAFVAIMAIHQFERIFGFPVAIVTVLDALIFKINFFFVGTIDLTNTSTIYAPGWTVSPDMPNGVCLPYQCLLERYADLPFLDLDQDAYLIKKFANGADGLNYLVVEAMIFVMMTYLGTKLGSFAQQIAKGLSGGGVGSMALGNAADNFKSSLSGIGGMMKYQIMGSGNPNSTLARIGRGIDSIKKGASYLRPDVALGAILSLSATGVEKAHSSMSKKADAIKGKGSSEGNAQKRLDQEKRKTSKARAATSFVLKAFLLPLSMVRNYRNNQEKFSKWANRGTDLGGAFGSLKDRACYKVKKYTLDGIQTRLDKMYPPEKKGDTSQFSSKTTPGEYFRAMRNKQQFIERSFGLKPGEAYGTQHKKTHAKGFGMSKDRNMRKIS